MLYYAVRCYVYQLLFLRDGVLGTCTQVLLEYRCRYLVLVLAASVLVLVLVLVTSVLVLLLVLVTFT